MIVLLRARSKEVDDPVSTRETSKASIEFARAPGLREFS
jgi:hypothetical protein